ncbi:MAG: flavin reductase family protein [Aeromicrobium erythreum]
MTIHDEHPFLPSEGDRDPLRRLRGRMPAPVSVWTTGTGRGRAGLTVSSFVVADGDPAVVLGLVDQEADFWDAGPERFVVNLLGSDHAWLAEVFAGQAPAPGGPFTAGSWRDTDWGPVLDDAVGWLGVRRLDGPPRTAGWSLLVEGVVEHVELADGAVLTHRRGRYEAG